MGPPPPVPPPLELLERNPVPTDPRRRVFAFEEERPEGWTLRLVWDADDPEILAAEYRAPIFDRCLPPSAVAGFWRAVKEKVAELGPLPVVGADPRP